MHEMVEANERVKALPPPSRAPAALGATASGLTPTPVANVNDEAGTTIVPRLSRRWMQDNYETYDNAPYNDDGYKNGVISHTFKGRLDDLYN